jgi:hypothetical protein
MKYVKLSVLSALLAFTASQSSAEDITVTSNVPSSCNATVPTTATALNVGSTTPISITVECNVEFNIVASAGSEIKNNSTIEFTDQYTDTIVLNSVNLQFFGATPSGDFRTTYTAANGDQAPYQAQDHTGNILLVTAPKDNKKLIAGQYNGTLTIVIEHDSL